MASKNTGSVAVSQRIFRLESPPVRALKRVPGDFVGTRAGVIVGMAVVLHKAYLKFDYNYQIKAIWRFIYYINMYNG